ncbi:cf54a409-6e35-4fd6-a58e-17eb474f5c9e [Sclerotinia trifoliorum]|uniref:Cf54a409-6e35-4fd6-a58e-17eb474f5c9e n=1 Tax=Sclerotinia trifoliorum TaxID=28548 RepID=A0A8H2ZJZ0_9HELO|nr:cf54a409-6e35-4fd6-a58e-17eb474f5c9e [Sclerotinia trifoliorum]
MITTSFTNLLSQFSSFPTSPTLPPLSTILFIYTPLIYLTLSFIQLLLLNIQNLQNPHLPPGPWYTRFTNLILRYHEWNGNRRIYIEELHKRFGESIRIGVREFAFCGMEGVRGVYGGAGGAERGLDKTGFYALFRQMGVRTTFSTERRLEHKEKKRNTAKPYRNTEILKPIIMDAIEERSRAFVRKIEEAENGTIDVYRYVHCYTLDCVSHVLLGKEGTKSIEEKAGMEMMNEMTYYSTFKTQLITFYLQPLSTFLLSLLPQKSTLLTNTHVFSTCLQPSQEPYTLLHTLQHATPPLTEIEIGAEIMDHLAAGIDTTGIALTYLLYTLSRPSNYGIQETLHRSLVSPLGNSERGIDTNPNTNTETDTNPNPNPNQETKITYTNAIINETLRLYTPIPNSQPRFVPKHEPKTIDKYLIPGNSTISVQAWSIHRNAQIFGDEVEEFRPERWLVGADEIREMERGYLAFGKGGRACIGKNLALAEMRHLVQEIYTKYRTRIKEGWEGDMEMEDQLAASRPRGQECMLVFEKR